METAGRRRWDSAVAVGRRSIERIGNGVGWGGRLHRHACLAFRLQCSSARLFVGLRRGRAFFFRPISKMLVFVDVPEHAYLFEILGGNKLHATGRFWVYSDVFCDTITDDYLNIKCDLISLCNI